MGEDLSSEQRLVLESAAKDPSISTSFYFTGGTALASFYLHHRLSDDIDLFTENKYDELTVLNFVHELAEAGHLKSNLSRINDRQEFHLIFPRGQTLVADFVYYPYKRLEKGKSYKGIAVDSLFDIAVNKLLTINQRTNPKDFVDLYFLLKKYTIWDLIPGVERKFGVKIDLLLLGADFLKVEEFDVLPRMKGPLTLRELKSSFLPLAKKLGGMVTK